MNCRHRRLPYQRIHGVIAFVPARLLALTYGIAGSFEESFSGWRSYLAAESDHFFDADLELIRAYADEARKCVYS